MTKRPDDLLDEVTLGYQASQVLFTANRLGLFARLGVSHMSSEELALALEADRRGTRILCDALVVLGLLDRNGETYANTELALRHLLPGSPEPRSSLLHHGAKLYERWGHLYDAVKTGSPVPDEQIDPRLMGNERDFALAMADVGRRSATATCELLDLAGARHCLDVGGGPGIYAIEFARRWPDLQVTILDHQEALEVARANADEAGLSARIHLQPGDAFADDLGGPYDVAFVSNVIHIYSAAQNRRLVERCAAALAPGGRLALKDFFLDEDRRSPAGGALFAVNMLVNTEAGDCYTVEEARAWMAAAGLEIEAIKEVAAKSRLLTALKPTSKEDAEP